MCSGLLLLLVPAIGLLFGCHIVDEVVWVKGCESRRVGKVSLKVVVIAVLLKDVGDVKDCVLLLMIPCTDNAQRLQFVYLQIANDK
jgi:hypothetical protein